MWVMSLRRERSGYTVFIGTVEIAEIRFKRRVVIDGNRQWGCRLHVGTDTYDHKNMGEAMRDLHRMLNSPPPEGAEAGRHST